MRGGPEAASEDMIPQEKVDWGVWVGWRWGGCFFFFPNLAARGRVTFHGGCCWTHSALEKNLRRRRRRRRAGEDQSPSISKNGPSSDLKTAKTNSKDFQFSSV